MVGLAAEIRRNEEALAGYTGMQYCVALSSGTAALHLALIMLNCVWVSFCFGILSTRYRDIGPLLGAVVQLLFFMTPIIWNANTLTAQGAGRWSKIIELNPLLHYLDIVRAPLLGAPQELRHWYVVLALTVIGWAVALLAMRQYRARVSYWV